MWRWQGCGGGRDVEEERGEVKTQTPSPISIEIDLWAVLVCWNLAHVRLLAPTIFRSRASSSTAKNGNHVSSAIRSVPAHVISSELHPRISGVQKFGPHILRGHSQHQEEAGENSTPNFNAIVSLNLQGQSDSEHGMKPFLRKLLHYSRKF